MTLLPLNHDSPGYQHKAKLHDVFFAVYQGAICCMQGANNSGKTTPIRALPEVIPLIDGDILPDRKAIQSIPACQRSSVVAWIPQVHDGQASQESPQTRLVPDRFPHFIGFHPRKSTITFFGTYQ